MSFIQAFSETPVTLQARAEIRRKIDETVQEVFQSIDENHVRLPCVCVCVCVCARARARPIACPHVQDGDV